MLITIYYLDGRSTEGILPPAFLHVSDLFTVPVWGQIKLMKVVSNWLLAAVTCFILIRSIEGYPLPYAGVWKVFTSMLS